ncbi:MAG: bifunctional proline dehydrogenase/L-glutamate gamma-semialdehyde dehydrogenase [Betaproteobacteria bacterium]|nr:bifunctional proline dehydrogenase/L-glutamate gamma-semialdehyde dehydrogenase [Betaproteobacteria bacterium]
MSMASATPHRAWPGHESELEDAVRALGHKLFAAARSGPPRLYRGLPGRVLEAVMHDARLRDVLFQFVDVLPQLRESVEISGHLAAFLDAAPGDDWPRRLLRLGARPSLAWMAQRQVAVLARRLLADETPAGIARVLRRLAGVPASVTVDAVGEAVLTEAEADAYLARNLRLLDWLGAAGGGTPQLSLKLTALTPHFDPLDATGTRARVFARLAPLMAAACRHHATLTVDMEQYELKPLILRLFEDMLESWPDPAWQPAIALQAYLPETGADLDRMLERARRHGRRLGVRLVKGAYWDQEVAWAAQRHWPLPVFADKAHTDAHFEQLTVRLLGCCDRLHPAIASHNLRSQTVALACARRLGLRPQQWEAQMLMGMAEPLRDALAAEGVRLRIYVPSGDLITGIAYLIRRLLENTASTSVLRQTYVEGGDAAALLAPPIAASGSAPPAPDLQPARHNGIAGFTNTPLTDFSREAAQEAFRAALRQVRAGLPRRHAVGAGLPAIGGAGVAGKPAPAHEVRNPANPEELLGEVELADLTHADAAVAAAGSAFPAWRDTAPRTRAALLRRAADLMESRRIALAALQVLEVAKNWREADADVAEAIDFLRYYAGEMERLDGWHDTVCFPGETNRQRYEPRGVAVVIAPWNFPLAILTGMSAAALVAGNCAILKPALPALLTAHALHAIYRAAGIPAEVCQLLPGDAPVGAHLVSHPQVHVVAFTGSRAVGLAILQAAHTPAPDRSRPGCAPPGGSAAWGSSSPAAGQRHVKQVVCEMGGKNAIVVDADADLDEAVVQVLHSAFGFQGQKCSACSRLIVHADIHDRLVERLADAAAAFPWGPPEDPRHLFGPLITPQARDKALRYIAIGAEEGRLAWQGRVPSGGWYVPPTIFTGIRPQHRLAREEVFGPVLAVLRAPSFEVALDMALDSEYALTGGVFSRLPAHLELAQERLRVGNLYLNRRITGARVGVQPFGGVALSGTGVQAGGPDYLKQFMWSRVVSANTQRHGFIPEG